MTKRPSISLVNGSQDERALAQMLNKLFETYNLERYLYTETVHIQEGVIPHSHPALTLSPSTFGTDYLDSPKALLATYIHEQMHWFTLLEQLEEGTSEAMRRFKLLYPELPTERPEGCGSDFSNYLHIMVNWLEYRALCGLLEEAQARVEISSRGYYKAIYRLVLEHDKDIEKVMTACKLLLPDTPPMYKQFLKVT